jgi:amino acid transporter
MTGPLIFLIITFFLSLIGAYASVKTDDPYIVVGAIPLIFAIVICLSMPVKTVYEPVIYKAESTTFKVFAITDKKIFESDKKVDFDNWTQGKEGYIRTEYSTFGLDIHTAFTTEKRG